MSRRRRHHLVHGTFGGAPATLLGLRFRFSYEPASSPRFTRPFDSDQASTPPDIAVFAPARIHSTVQTAHISHTREVLPAIGVNPPVAGQIGISGKMGRTIDYTREYSTDVEGNLWTSDDAFDEVLDVDDCVSWTVLEMN
jgi:hypothetical protein